MVVHNVSYTTPADGTNLLEGYNVALSNRWRQIMKVGFIGGANIADGHLQISIGSKIVVDIRNCANTDVILQEHIFPEGGDKIPPSIPLSAVLGS